MTSKPVVMVIGASGIIGSATINALVSRHSSTLDIQAGVRDIKKAEEKFREFKGVIKIVHATMGDENLPKVFQGVNRLFIVTPPTKDRAELTAATARSAKQAGVKTIMVVSGCAAEDKLGFVIGEQFKQIERTIQDLGIPFTIVRLPGFLENYYGFRDSIMNESCIHMPVDPNQPYTPVAAADVGKAAATILDNPAKHTGKTYDIVSNRHTMNEACREFSRQLGKDVKYVRISYEEARASFLKAGIPDWHVDGMMHSFKMMDKGSHASNLQDIDDFRRITGMESTSLADWIACNRFGFQ